MIGKTAYLAAFVMLCVSLCACNSIDDERIPALPVNLKLDNVGLWNTYGVAGYGQYRYFIKEERIPSDFPFLQTTYTGFGGVLLISGMDPFTSETDVPMAYDLSCPVECKREIRVAIDGDNLDAVCPICGSRYNVVMSGGAPVAGPALTEKVKYRLQPYHCISTPDGGYIITR